MLSKNFRIEFTLAALFSIIIFSPSKAVALAESARPTAGDENVLHSFDPNNGDGLEPVAGMVFDAAGNLYGTTAGGGANSIGCSGIGCGAVFEMTPDSDGTWTEKVIYSFCSVSGCTDGSWPASGLIFDSAGNLYGTTSNGGASGAACGGFGCGTVFQLTPEADGKWTEAVLHSFQDNNEDGFAPEGGLIFDGAGNLYGTTYYGGRSRPYCGHSTFHCGTVFQLTPGADGTWTETVLHSFQDDGEDGYNPRASLTLDAAGNLYGTTYSGGAYKYGTVFELTPRAGARWAERVLHSFRSDSSDGGNPVASLIFDAAGNLYGTTMVGGGDSGGTVFELTPAEGGGWAERVLHRFGAGYDGSQPDAPVIFDASGNLYGTTGDGGANGPDCNGHGQGCGTVFELIPQTNGGWTERVLHSFNDDGADGYAPTAGLIFDAAGNLYGTTLMGGAYGTGCDGYGCGTVFEIAP